jgi:hypothetical protein
MIFNPVDMMGPAHKSNQTLQQLAQAASQSVLRRQKMRNLISQGARGGAGAGPGMGQPFRSSLNGRPGGVKSSVLMRMLGGPGANGMSNGHGSDGVFGNAGGGFDYPSLPAPASQRDPAQSFQSTTPNLVAQVPAAPPGPMQPTPPPPGVATPQSVAAQGGFATSSGSGYTLVGPDSKMAGHVDTASPDVSMIHLGDGIFYDPNTDTIARHPGQQG